MRSKKFADFHQTDFTLSASGERILAISPIRIHFTRTTLPQSRLSDWALSLGEEMAQKKG
jgi:hypothetical protein